MARTIAFGIPRGSQAGDTVKRAATLTAMSTGSYIGERGIVTGGTLPGEVWWTGAKWLPTTRVWQGKVYANTAGGVGINHDVGVAPTYAHLEVLNVSADYSKPLIWKVWDLTTTNIGFRAVDLGTNSWWSLASTSPMPDITVTVLASWLPVVTAG